MEENGLLHIDEGVSKALAGLNQEIKRFFDQSGRECTILFIPHIPEEKIVMAVNGKVLDEGLKTPPEQILALAMKERRKEGLLSSKTQAWHVDANVERALIRFNDEVCTFERETSREYTLLLIPHSSKEMIVMAQSGKPLPPDFDMEPEEILSLAMTARNKG